MCTSGDNKNSSNLEPCGAGDDSFSILHLKHVLLSKWNLLICKTNLKGG